ncbi:MAG: TonB-dependent receptor [Mariniphaga sp.]
MKTNRYNLKKTRKSTLLNLVFFICILHSIVSPAQSGYTISGNIISAENGEAVAFANVALFDSTQNRILNGAAGNETGTFILNGVTPGTYKMQVSALGFESQTRKVEMNGNLNLGFIPFSETSLQLKDVDVVAQRIKAKSEPDKTTFFVNRKMHESSNTGTDILKLVPGLQVDLQQNVSLEGSQNVIILVDGKERDRSFLSQLPASKIDKVEVISSPPARYDADITGVINVVLSREEHAGIDGHVYLEIPTSGSEIFLTPAYSLNYGFGKFNLFTSYNGDLLYFNITESYRREIFGNTEINEITSIQNVRQKTWSHRFHYGVDWFINERNQLNFYAFYNPYSQEHDGEVEVKSTGSETSVWQAGKEDKDLNYSGFYSLWYNHFFDKNSGHELALDMSLHNLKAENATLFNNHETGYYQENKVMPNNQNIHVKLDYSLPVGKKMKLDAGFQTRLTTMNDRNSTTFRYDETVFAGYGTFSYKSSKLETTLGLRFENQNTKLHEEKNRKETFLSPNFSAIYNLNEKQTLKLNYRRSLSWPGFYQLNSYTSVEDPFTLNSGNANLRPETHNQVNLEYSRRFKNHFFSARLFYHKTSDAIRNLLFLNNDGLFEIQKNNLGEIRQTGIQFNGTLSFGKVGINPYLKLFYAFSMPNQLAAEHQVESKHKLVLESGLSAFATFKKGFTASINFQYTSPANQIQKDTFSDALYFVSLEKSISKNLKAGIVSGLPLTKTFTYQGSEVAGPEFYNYSKGEIQLSSVPFWFKISYRFSSGKNLQKIERTGEVPVQEKRKGF